MEWWYVVVLPVTTFFVSLFANQVIDWWEDRRADRDRMWEFIEELTRLRDTHASEIVRVQEQRDEWRQVARLLVSGAEQQIDDLRGTAKPDNPAWLRAWLAYDQAENRG